MKEGREDVCGVGFGVNRLRDEERHVLGRDGPNRVVVKHDKGDDVGSKGMSITDPARLRPNERVVSRTLVPGGYGLLMTGVLLRWSETNRPLL
jgi:hypothetical protein